MRVAHRTAAPLDPDALDLAAAAAEIGVHYDTLKKHWRDWSNPEHAAFCAFPAPFRFPPPGQRGRLAWRRTAVADWKVAREHAFGAGRAAPAALPSGRRAVPLFKLQRDRAALARLMETA